MVEVGIMLPAWYLKPVERDDLLDHMLEVLLELRGNCTGQEEHEKRHCWHCLSYFVLFVRYKKTFQKLILTIFHHFQCSISKNTVSAAFTHIALLYLRIRHSRAKGLV